LIGKFTILRHVHPLHGDVILTSVKSLRAHDTVTLLQRETPEFIHPEMWNQFAGF